MYSRSKQKQFAIAGPYCPQNLKKHALGKGQTNGQQAEFRQNSAFMRLLYNNTVTVWCYLKIFFILGEFFHLYL
jgi:hypothetical protein